MRKVIVSEFVTLDGVFEDPGGAEKTKNGGWSFKIKPSADQLKFKLDEVKAAGALLLGRRTYQGFAKAWPSMKDDVGFASKMNSMQKYVVSTTLKKSEWSNSIIIKGDVVDEVRKLKQEPGKDLLVAGSGELVKTLMENGLVDEFRLMVHPIILGSGRRLFENADTVTLLSLASSKTFESGNVLLTYVPQGKPS